MRNLEALTLTSVFAVTVPVTLGLTHEQASVLLPTTLVITCAFWGLGNRVTRPGRVIAYCLIAGAIAGVLNIWLSLFLWLRLFMPGALRYIDADVSARITALGAMVGIAYGAVYLLPMLIRLSARSLRRSEGIDRCLIGYGAWGVLVLFLALRIFFAFAFADTDFAHSNLVFGLALGGIGLHALMLSVGLVRWARRRWWLGRVVTGNVPGWLVCERQQFQQSDLEELEVFCKPLFNHTPPHKLRVLARGAATDPAETYRSGPLAPRFLIV